MAEENKWYPLRVTYGRELKLKERLDQLQVTSYIPMRYRKVEKDGKRKTVLVPAVNNLCFAYTTRDVIDRLRSGLLEALPFHYIWDKATSLPIVVPDKAMDDFIKVSSSLEDDLVYLSEVSPLLRAGQKHRGESRPHPQVQTRDGRAPRHACRRYDLYQRGMAGKGGDRIAITYKGFNDKHNRQDKMLRM